MPPALPARDPLYRVVVRVALALLRALGVRLDLRGDQHLPVEGGAVLAATHVSYLDFVLVGVPAHRRGRRLVRFLAKKSVFDHPITGPLMRGMRHIPVDRAAGAGAYRSAVSALGRGELVGVFPEQTISRSFVPRPMRTGAARMALEAGVPLIPVAVWGGQRIWTSGRRPRLARRVPVSVWVDQPLAVSDGESAAELTTRLQHRLTALVEQIVREYPEAPRGGAAWWWPAHAGGQAPTPQQAAAAEAASIAARAPQRA